MPQHSKKFEQRRGGASHWRSYVDEFAHDYGGSSLDDFFVPHYGGFGHNSSRFFGNPDQVLRSETNGRVEGFVTAPRLDIDEHMALMLLMGINDKITFRKHLTTQEMKQDGNRYDPRIDGKPPERGVLQYLLQSYEDGKQYAPIILRLPNEYFNGKRYKRGRTANPNVLEFPVLIELNEASIKQWRQEEIAQLVHPEDGDKDAIGSDPSDKIAQSYGFATARDMQNSKPLQLNNHWLRLNSSRAEGKEGEIRFHEGRKKKLKSKIATAEKRIAKLEGRIEEIETGVASTPGNQKKLDALLDQMSEARIKADALHPHVESAFRALKAHEKTLADFYDATRELDKAEKDTPEYKRKNTELRRAIYDANEAYLGNPRQPGAKRLAALERSTREHKVSGLRNSIQGWQVRLEKYKTYLAETEGELKALEENTFAQHRYADTDHMPDLITVKVAAAHPRAYLKHISDTPSTETVKAVQDIYWNDVYPRALDNQNGWLRDALSAEPAKHTLRASHRFFEHMHQDAQLSGRFTGDFNEFITSKDSPLKPYIDKAATDSMSDPMLSAYKHGRHIRQRNHGAVTSALAK